MNEKIGSLDYLIIGHITHDLIGEDAILGGTVTYSGVCARNLGYQTGILTSCEEGLKLAELEGIQISTIPSKSTTTFENIETKSGRKQYLHEIAERITVAEVSNIDQQAKIIHLGPVADEIDREVINVFPDAFIGLTPQGWMRHRDEKNVVQYKVWEDADFLLQKANAVVLSTEDVKGDRKLVNEYAAITKVLAMTEGYNGAFVYWNGDVRHFAAPKVPVIDPTGAGDIFAAAFFATLYSTNDPWISAKQAVAIASASVSKVGIEGVPTPEEMRALQIDVI